VDLSDDEIIRFFKELDKAGVRSILVGGMAVNYHGFNRSTGDVDVWLDDSELNRKRFVNALKSYGIEGAELFHNLPFVAGYTEIALDDGTQIDLMSDLQFFKKEKFNECFALAQSCHLAVDVVVKVLHVNTLIEEKSQSARLQDKVDADTLKKLYQK